MGWIDAERSGMPPRRSRYCGTSPDGCSIRGHSRPGPHGLTPETFGFVIVWCAAVLCPALSLKVSAVAAVRLQMSEGMAKEH